jgi:dTDP-4-dehydrorhamnose 3,5-epimerase
MKFELTHLEGILVLYPNRFQDERGYFLETFEIERYRKIGILDEFVQDNHSRSFKNVLRGMHYTVKRPQAQLLTVMRGTIFDAVVDVRENSSTYGQWFGIELSAEGDNACQVYMAPGFAHGFCVLSEFADLHYKVSQKYDRNDDAGIHYADPKVGIKWPVKTPIVSEKDLKNPFLK